VFPDDDAVVITVVPDPLAAALLGADAPAGELLAAPVLLLLPPLEQAATSRAAPTAPPTPVASLAGVGIRFTLEILIVFFSLSSTAGPCRFPQAVDTGTGRSTKVDWMPRGKQV
jgi:hypothetical protein